MKQIYHNQGFSLVEVLVAMLIIATAVLGTAGVQSTSLRQHQNTHTDAQAAYLAQELRETILAYEHPNYPGLFSSISPQSTNDCYNTTCTHTQMTEYLMWNWQERLNKSLHLSQYQLVYSAADQNYLLQIVWDADGDGITEEPTANDCANTVAAGRGKYCLVVYPNG